MLLIKKKHTRVTKENAAITSENWLREHILPKRNQWTVGPEKTEISLWKMWKQKYMKKPKCNSNAVNDRRR